ncbi:MAG: hypothetical protein ABI239_01100 [Aquihabitans sp.]
MTEPLPPLSDEDLSAALDGMAEPDVEARIQADPSARARLDALRAASETIGRGSAPTLDANTVDALIAQAIEVGNSPAEDGEPSSAPQVSPDGVVTPLAPRRRSGTGTQRWLVAAVIVVLMAIGLGLVYSGTRSPQNETAAVSTQNERAASSSDTAEPAADGADAAMPDHFDTEASGAAPEADASDQEPAALDQLGSFDDIRSLRSELRDGFPPDSAPVVGDRPSNISVDRCNNFIQTVLGNMSPAPEPEALGYVSVDGDPYLVYEYSITDSSTSGSKLITAANPDSCDLLFNFVR